MLTLNSWNVDFWPGGWVRAVDETGATVVLRLLPQGEGRTVTLRAQVALMTSSKPVTARMWRDVPIAAIEQHVMQWALFKDLRPHYEAMLQPAEIEGLSAEKIDRYFQKAAPLPIGSHLFTDTLVSDEGEPRADFKLIERPLDGRLTDEFLENLAEVYRWAVESGKPPAPLIAELSKSSVRTVHGWVSEARKRGFLPPAVKGKAG